MRPTDPFTPFLNHEDIRQRRMKVAERPGVEEVFDAPDRSVLGSRFHHPRVRIFVLMGLLIASGFVIRLIHLQMVIGATFRDQAENNRVRREVVTAPRGVIEDRSGLPVALNRPTFVARVVPKEWNESFTERQQVEHLLRDTLGITPDQFSQAIADTDVYGVATVADDIPLEPALALTTAATRVRGLSIVPVAARTYPLGAAGAHVLGYVGKPTAEEERTGYDVIDTVGRTGLEAQYESTLRGKNGAKEIERDSTNQEHRILATINPTAGQNIRLTIDAGLQQELFAALDAKVRGTSATGGAAIAIDPRTGAVLALVSSPSYDPNAFARGFTVSEYQTLISDPGLPLFPRALAGEYPSGSTIKPFLAAAALDADIITPRTIISSTGGIRIGQWFFPDWKSGGHGGTDVRKALAESVNTFFYTIGGGNEQFTGLGIERMTDAVRGFGFGSLTNIDLPAEQNGFLPSKRWKEETKKEAWYIGDTYHFAIGQGDILVTPLQLATGSMAIANGGTVYQPHVLASEYTADHTLLRTVSPTIVRQGVAKSESLRVVREGMREAVLSGSARALSALPVPAAGKTGTAQFGAGEKTHSWFTGFAPFDSPEIVVTVFVEGGGEGHAAALPVAQQALSWYFTRDRSSP